MSNILIVSESRYPIKRKFVKKVVTDFLKDKLKSDYEVSIAIIGDRKMAQINKKYRQKEGTTPVLTFSQTENTNSKFQPRKTTSFEANILRLGDIVISYPQVVDYARTEEKMVDEILAEFLEHGLSNLLGLS